MRIPRLYFDYPLATGKTVRLDQEASQYLSRVLRLQAGAELRLFNGDGRDFEAKLLHTSKHGAEVMLGTVSAPEAEPVLHCILAQGISKGDRMDYSLQKAVELGISGFVPLFTQRTVVQLEGERQERRLAHWRKVMISACEQSGRRRLPHFETPQTLPDWLDTLENPTGLVLHHRAAHSLDSLPPPTGPVYLLIGPEGGLGEEEIERACSRGFKAVRMGPRILRTETAPVAALAAMQMLWGDFRNTVASGE